jgi:hypothetical protein
VCLARHHLKSRDPEGGTISPHIKTPLHHVLCSPKLCPLSTDYLLPKLGISFPNRNSSPRTFTCGASFAGVNSVLSKTPQSHWKPCPPCRVPNWISPYFLLGFYSSFNPIQSNKLWPSNTNTVQVRMHGHPLFSHRKKCIFMLLIWIRRLLLRDVNNKKSKGSNIKKNLFKI